MKLILLLLLGLFACSTLSSQINYREDYYGNLIATDNYGSIVATRMKDYNGNFTWVNPAGYVLYTQTRDYYGNWVTKDSQGRILSTYQNQSQQGGVYNIRPTQTQDYGGINPTPIVRNPLPPTLKYP